MMAADLVEAAGIKNARRIIADFAAGGFVKSYAKSIETIDERGVGTVVLGPKIPSTLWKRIVQTGQDRDVWSTGTVHLAGSAIITAITFKPNDIDELIAHHVGKSRSRRPDPQPSVELDASLPAVTADAPLTRAKEREPNPSAIPPGALLASVDEAMSALGVSRGTINNLINNGTLIRTKIGRAVRIEVASIHALAGSAR